MRNDVMNLLGRRALGMVAVVVYGTSVYLANWLIRHAGTVEIAGGTWLLPVGFGLLAPSGTYVAAITLVARDVVQRTIGRRWSLVVIVPGIALTALMSAQLALASGLAFALGELADYAVYTPLQARRLTLAVFASVAVGSVVDSVLFLGVAGIPFTAALPGLLLGKLWVALICIPLVRLARVGMRALAI